MNEQEAWFEFVGLGPIGRYMPIHWKGWAIVLFLGGLGALTSIATEWLSRTAGHPQWQWPSDAVTLVILLMLFRTLAKRRSRKTPEGTVG